MEKEKVIETSYMIHEYKDEISPYLASLAKGLRGGAIYLRAHAETKIDKMAAQMFAEAASGFEEALLRLEVKDRVRIREGKQSFMSSSSLFFGLFLAKVGQHLRETRSELSKE